MSLIDLPTELLQRVIGETMPLGFESSLLSCKTVYEAGKTFLARHNSLRRRYRRFDYDDYHNEIRCSLQLLHRIADDPLIGEYIEVADFRLDACSPIYKMMVIDDWASCLAEAKGTDAALRDLLKRSPYMKAANLDADRWLDEIKEECANEGDPIHTAVFLLSLLPNLRELALPRRWPGISPTWSERSEDYGIWRFLDVLAQRANQGDEASLSKLAVIQPCLEPGYESRGSLQALGPFLAMPSVRKLSATSCIAVRDGYTGIPFDWRYPELSSNLEEIELAYSCLTGAELGNLLSRTPRLRSFKLAYETKWHGCGHDWDVGSVFESLEQHCGSTLEELSITIERFPGDLSGGVSSLLGFTRLRSLEVDLRFFGEPSVSEELHNSQTKGQGSQPQATASSPLSRPAFTEILPPTLKSLRLLSRLEPEVISLLESLLHNIEAHKAEKFPLLDNITVSCATSKLGDHTVAEHDTSLGDRVGDLVRSKGCAYTTSSEVHAAWVDL